MAYLFWDINRTQFDNNELTKMNDVVIIYGCTAKSLIKHVLTFKITIITAFKT
jgi:hypothetical protein